MRAAVSGLIVTVHLLGVLPLWAADDGEDWGTYALEDGRRSGYTYAAVETRAMQDDEFDNSGFIWVEKGAELWSEVDGSAGKACGDCHGDVAESMRGVGARYPVFAPEFEKLVNLEQRINQCRSERMGAEPWTWESEPLLAMTTYVRHQSHGMPVSPVIDGPAAPFFETGKAFYETRRGQLDLACIHCHEMNSGNMLRAQRLSQGMSNGFPTYRLKWQTIGSLHRRIRGCNEDVRAETYAPGSDEYVNLELYLAWRARGLPVETPAVRN
ncbi:MAG: sulfur oxidation c-type cytochrome SoxA [Gammaproteobacteria bacterium]